MLFEDTLAEKPGVETLKTKLMSFSKIITVGIRDPFEHREIYRSWWSLVPSGHRLMLCNAHRSLCPGGRLLCIVPSLESALYVHQRCEEERAMEEISWVPGLGASQAEITWLLTWWAGRYGGKMSFMGLWCLCHWSCIIDNIIIYI